MAIVNGYRQGDEKKGKWRWMIRVKPWIGRVSNVLRNETKIGHKAIGGVLPLGCQERGKQCLTKSKADQIIAIQ